ncbi:sugar phosphate isomerase/epimerase [Cellulomonas hominis]|uniref:sugar phosphate isomerase/epimerase family protein n=1 Tax=Cellulomonas hominis TaxID=156981 RepID=UPI001C0F58B8|nr:sugar phosphate isomerase/epimerase [Cellulomonas hominis]MBU5421235.1 sugar phosphate isomerase/epimerase [Cellulomonas hominis]
MSVPRLSVQLYPFREQLAADPDATFARLAGLGFDAVEPFALLDRPAELAARLARHGLSAPSVQAPFLSDDIEFGGHRVPLPPLSVTVGAARSVGAEILLDPMVPADRWRDRDEVARTADRLNDAADTAAAAGLRVGYHNHTVEFSTTIDGASAYEHFVSLLDPRVVLEVDVYWAAVAGQDVPALLRRLGDRVRALHVKDGPLVADPFATAGGYDPASFGQLPAGQGELPVAQILAAVPHAELDVIEFDRAPGDPFEAVAASARFVREVRAGGAV